MTKGRGVARQLLCHHIEIKSRQARSNNNSNEAPTGGRVPRKACLDEERATVFFVPFAVSAREPSQPDEPRCGRTRRLPSASMSRQSSLFACAALNAMRIYGSVAALSHRERRGGGVGGYSWLVELVLRKNGHNIPVKQYPSC